MEGGKGIIGSFVIGACGLDRAGRSPGTLNISVGSREDKMAGVGVGR
jgi:hypothetical protein